VQALEHRCILGARVDATSYPDATAQAVLDARAKYPDLALADLYDPLMMPAPLLKAHQELDRSVDRCYRPDLSTFPSLACSME
jgi:hypothetical protein